MHEIVNTHIRDPSGAHDALRPGQFFVSFRSNGETHVVVLSSLGENQMRMATQLAETENEGLDTGMSVCVRDAREMRDVLARTTAWLRDG
jgi:hypothetical protein